MMSFLIDIDSDTMDYFGWLENVIHNARPVIEVRLSRDFYQKIVRSMDPHIQIYGGAASGDLATIHGVPIIIDDRINIEGVVLLYPDGVPRTFHFCPHRPG